MVSLVEFGQSWILARVGVKIQAEDDFFLGAVLDSLTFNELLSALENEFAIEFKFDEIEDWSQVSNLAGLANLSRDRKRASDSD